MRLRSPLLVVLSVVYIDMLGIGLAFPVLPRLIEQFEGGDVSRASYIYGALAAAYSLMQFLLAPLLGALSDRFGRRPVILLALVGMGINYLLLAFAPTLVLFAVGRMIAGAFGATFSGRGRLSRRHHATREAGAGLRTHRRGVRFRFHYGARHRRPARRRRLAAAVRRRRGFEPRRLRVAYFALPESLAADNRRAFDWRRANPIGALRAVGRYGSVLGLMAIFVLATFANRVAEMTWVLFTGYRFGWGPTETGLSLAMVGVMFVVGQGGLVRIVVPRLGERRAIVLGLGVSAVVCVPVRRRAAGLDDVSRHGLRGSRLDVAQPAVQALMSRSVPANEQGLLQGALASMTNLTSIFGPPIWTGLFGYFVSSSAPVIVPGAAFFAAAGVFLVALVVARRWFKTARIDT